MHEDAPPARKKPYAPYERYLSSRDGASQPYVSDEESSIARKSRDPQEAETLPALADDMPVGTWPSRDPFSPAEDNAFRPLRLLNSLYSDRLDFLSRALEELETDRSERRHLTREALEQLDSDADACEHLLREPRLIHPDRRRELERRLLDLKRERRKERLMSWRDLVWLKGEIRKLRREIESFGRIAVKGREREDRD